MSGSVYVRARCKFAECAVRLATYEHIAASQLFNLKVIPHFHSRQVDFSNTIIICQKCFRHNVQVKCCLIIYHSLYDCNLKCEI